MRIAALQENYMKSTATVTRGRNGPDVKLTIKRSWIQLSVALLSSGHYLNG